MPLVELKCKSCGAVLKVSTDSRYVTCAYCDSTLEREMSDEERGMLSAGETAEKVDRYKKDYLKLSSLINRRKMLEKSTDVKKDNLSDSVLDKFKPKTVLAVCLVMSVLILIASGTDGIGAALFFAIVGGCTFFLLKLLRKSRENDLEIAKAKEQEEFERRRKQLGEVERLIAEVNATFDIHYIPEKYREESILDQIYDILISGRAYTLNAAFNIYEDATQQKQSIMLQQQQINEIESLRKMQQEMLQNQQKENSGNLGKTAALLGGAIIGSTVKKSLTDSVGKNVGKVVGKTLLNAVKDSFKDL